MGAGQRGERGAVTAEAALVLPVLAAVTLALIWMLGLAVAQMRVSDAAREAARALARGDPEGEAAGLAHTAAPGSTVRIDQADGRVRVTVVRPPGDLLGDLGAARIAATAEALIEGTGEAP